MATETAVHLITVDAEEDNLARTQALIEVLRPKSHRAVGSLAELGELQAKSFAADAPSIVQLFGASNTEILTKLSSKGRVATEVAILGFADGIVVEPGQPVRAVGVLPQAFVSAVATTKLSYDATGAGLLIGACDVTRAVAAGLSRLGFKRLMIVDPDDKKTEQMVAILRKRLFGVKIEAVSRALLTQLPSECSIAINLVSAKENLLLEDVSYLNFLQTSGVWIDWTAATEQLGYDDEIVSAGAQVFSADIVRAWRDVALIGALPELLQATGQKPDLLVAELTKVWSAASLNPRPTSKTDPS